MLYNAASHKSLDQVISSVLKVPFEGRRLAKYKFPPKELHDLALAVQSHYDQFQLPPKSQNQLRPYISPRFTQSQKLGLEYVFSEKHFSSDFRYKFDPSISGELTQNIKKYLLYCHGLCIHDPLPYLLDYFRLAPDDDNALARLPAVRALLIEYAGFQKLIREGIVIPISDEMFGPRSMILLDPEEESFLKEKIPHLQDHVKELGSIVREEQSNNRR